MQKAIEIISIFLLIFAAILSGIIIPFVLVSLELLDGGYVGGLNGIYVDIDVKDPNEFLMWVFKNTMILTVALIFVLALLLMIVFLSLNRCEKFKQKCNLLYRILFENEHSVFPIVLELTILLPVVFIILGAVFNQIWLIAGTCFLTLICIFIGIVMLFIGVNYNESSIN